MRKLILGALIVVSIVGCTQGSGGGGGGAGDPVGAVHNVLNAIKDKRLSAVGAMICSAKRDQITKQLDITAAMASAAPGLDQQQILDAMTLGYQDLSVTKVSESGDTAVVAVKGKLTMTIDPGKAHDLVKAFLSAAGQTPTDEQIDQVLPTMIDQLARGQDIDSEVEVVREGGVWLVCSNPSAQS